MVKGKFLSKKILLFALCVFAQTLCFSQDKKFNLYYFGVVTNVNDQNMLNITQDLFFAQLRGIGYLDAKDMRDDDIKDSYKQIQTDESGEAFFNLAQGQVNADNSIIFVARIYRPRSDEKWQCAFIAKNLSSGTVASKGKEYDSYYKILTDAKVLIQSVVSQASGNIDSDGGGAQKITGGVRPDAAEIGTDNIAGSWGGERDASKIILLRSGRGFIVFNNGATMNVTVSAKEDGSSIKILQRDKFNASFYPDIDRQTILNYADSAPPIEWNLTLTKTGSLVGKKKTLVQSGAAVEPASLDVAWTRK
ncbi:MAG: hypothetical protein J6V90_08905 [Treponema sp.]|nr:hypothetical protein [Treponema sp.]